MKKHKRKKEKYITNIVRLDFHVHVKQADLPYLNQKEKKNEKTQKEKGKIHHTYSQIRYSRTHQASRYCYTCICT